MFRVAVVVARIPRNRDMVGGDERRAPHGFGSGM